MAGQAILKAQKFPQEKLPVLGKLSKVHATFRAANRSNQRNRQQIEQLMPLRIPSPGVRNPAQNLQQRRHSHLQKMRTSESILATSESQIFKCDSPGGGTGAQ